jgi:selenide,water dikinase
VYRISDTLGLIQTIDFFTPIVDDPYAFGAIAAANALSDVYAMGGRPIVALNVLCFPDKRLDGEVLAQILLGGHDKVHEAGAVIGGGHSVSDDELKYGLSVTGVVHPDRFWRNAGAQVGDVLVLSKGLGTGVLATALKRGELDEAAQDRLVASMSTLNRAASESGLALREGDDDPVHSATDVTGYGLLGHAIEVARASDVRLRIDAAAVPALEGAWQAIEGGFITRGDRTNFDYLRGQVEFGDGVSSAQRSLLLDPQTSGGLLFFVDASRADELVDRLEHGCVVGEVVRDGVGIDVMVG